MTEGVGIVTTSSRDEQSGGAVRTTEGWPPPPGPAPVWAPPQPTATPQWQPASSQRGSRAPYVGAVVVLLLGVAAYGLSVAVNRDTDEKYPDEVTLLNRIDADPSEAAESLEQATDRTVRTLRRFGRAVEANATAGNHSLDVSERSVDLWNAGDSAGSAALANGELVSANEEAARTNQRELLAYRSMAGAVEDLQRELRRGPR
jgi:hypothetical protein